MYNICNYIKSIYKVYKSVSISGGQQITFKRERAEPFTT